MKTALYIYLSIFLITITFFSGCIMQDSGGSHQDDKVKEFKIGAKNFEFSPSRITVDQGDAVRIILVNKDGEHNLFIEGYDIRTDVTLNGDRAVLEFSAKDPGTFDFWCEVRDHKELGMVGELIVQ